MKNFRQFQALFGFKKTTKNALRVNFFVVGIQIFFCELRAHAIFHDPWTTPSGRIVMWEKERRRKKIQKNWLT